MKIDPMRRACASISTGGSFVALATGALAAEDPNLNVNLQPNDGALQAFCAANYPDTEGLVFSASGSTTNPAGISTKSEDGYTLTWEESVGSPDSLIDVVSVTEVGDTTPLPLQVVVAFLGGNDENGYELNPMVTTVELNVPGSNGQNVTHFGFCAITTGEIIVEKFTNPAGDPTTFDFTATWGTFTLGDGDSTTSGRVAPGTYSVSEAAVPGWALTSAVCDDGSSPSAIDLQIGELVTCTFTNTKQVSVEVMKTESGGVPTMGFTFEIRQGASTTAAGTILATATTDATGFTDFGGITLTPGATYQLCETGMLPGWTNDIAGFTPFGSNNSTECIDFTGTPGETVGFNVDNVPPPGGDARTIGFWKNWTSCDGRGNQAPVLDDTLALAGGTIVIGDYAVDTCEEAVALLNKRDGTNGKKRASDAAYALGSQLLAAELNLVAGAASCADIANAISDAQALLDSIDFDGSGSYLKGGKNASPLRADASALAATIDAYNNNLLC